MKLKVPSVECRVRRAEAQRPKCFTPHASRTCRAEVGRRRITHHAFTLIELMVVISIMAVVLLIGIPSLRKVWEKGTFQRTLNDLQEVCSYARAYAILQGVTTEIVFHPKDGRVEMVATSAQPSQNGPAAPVNPYSVYNNGVEVRSEDTTVIGGQQSEGSSGSQGGPVRSAQIPQNVVIQMLDVNLIEYKDAEIARVHFYPNGTSDELTLILHSDEGVQRGISLEVTTGLASILVEADLQRLARGRL